MIGLLNSLSSALPWWRQRRRPSHSIVVVGLPDKVEETKHLLLQTQIMLEGSRKSSSLCDHQGNHDDDPDVWPVVIDGFSNDDDDGMVTSDSEQTTQAKGTNKDPDHGEPLLLTPKTMMKLYPYELPPEEVRKQGCEHKLNWRSFGIHVPLDENIKGVVYFVDVARDVGRIYDCRQQIQRFVGEDDLGDCTCGLPVLILAYATTTSTAGIEKTTENNNDDDAGELQSYDQLVVEDPSQLSKGLEYMLAKSYSKNSADVAVYTMSSCREGFKWLGDQLLLQTTTTTTTTTTSGRTESSDGVGSNLSV